MSGLFKTKLQGTTKSALNRNFYMFKKWIVDFLRPAKIDSCTTAFDGRKADKSEHDSIFGSSIYLSG